MSDVLVVGWISLDFIGEVDSFPVPGASVVAKDFDVACGGRAANQAMALTAIEGDVSLIARVGGDQHAQLLLDEMVDIGVGSDYVTEAPAATGLRLIAQQQHDGEQMTIVFRGANDFLTVDDLNRRADAFARARAVGVTTEPAGAVVLRALELAEQAGIPKVLTYHPSNLATSDRVLTRADVVVVSDATCAGLLDQKIARNQPEQAVRALNQRGAAAVVLLTPDRAILSRTGDARQVPSPSRLDTEDAVDAFVAGLLQGLAQDEQLEEAVIRGVRTSCLLIDD
jgi:ribokinase